MTEVPIGSALEPGVLGLLVCAECKQPASFGNADAHEYDARRVVTYLVTVEPCGHQSVQPNPNL